MAFKKGLLVSSILEQRAAAITKIVSNFKMLMKRKEIQEFLSKKKKYYIIKSGIGSCHGLKLKVLLSNNKEKIFPFEYCKYLEKDVIYIPKKNISSKMYQVNFISNGKVIIDPNYRCEKIGEQYINIINFEKFTKEEIEEEQNFKREIKYYMSYLRRKDIKFDYSSRKNSSHTDKLTDAGGDSEISADDGCVSTGGYSKKNRVKSGALEINCCKATLSSNQNLPKMKRKQSILKMPMFRRLSSSTLKKVSFGKVQFSS